MRKHSIFLVIALLFCCLVAACTAGTGNQGDLTGNLKISGSTALLPLVQKAAQTFEQLHPQTHITVAGGGSKKGLQDVSNGVSNIGDSDIYADPALYPDPNITDHIVCVTPFTMIVNKDVPLGSLTNAQIQNIFSTGTYSNWQQVVDARGVHGPDLPIQAVVRAPTSGTRDTFRKYVLGGLDERGRLVGQDSSQQVLDAVAKTPGAIGYLALSVLQPQSNVRVLAINGYQATLANIDAGSYAFWSYEHMYTLGDTQALSNAFLAYMLSSIVQQQAQALHYISINQLHLPAVGAIGQVSHARPVAISFLPESEKRRYGSRE